MTDDPAPETTVQSEPPTDRPSDEVPAQLPPLDADPALLGWEQKNIKPDLEKRA